MNTCSGLHSSGRLAALDCVEARVNRKMIGHPPLYEGATNSKE